MLSDVCKHCTAAGCHEACPTGAIRPLALAEKLGARVAIQHTHSGKGKLVVSYNSLDELDGILEHIR